MGNKERDSAKTFEEFLENLEPDRVPDEDKAQSKTPGYKGSKSNGVHTTTEDFSTPRRPRTGLRDRY